MLFPTDEYDECSNDGCPNPTPWDMTGVGVDSDLCCSLPCAREHYDALDGKPDQLVLHDPQYDSRRPVGVDEETVNVVRNVRRDEDIEEAFNDIGALINEY
jgi:hypothetical protein